MKILSKQEGENWLRENNLPVQGAKLRKCFNSSLAYRYNEKASTQIVLADMIGNIWEGNKGEQVFWIADWSISYENRPIEEASFHLFDESDLIKVKSLLLLSMFFCWDAYLISPNRGMVFSPNDFFVYASCKEKQDIERFRKLFDWMKLEK